MTLLAIALRNLARNRRRTAIAISALSIAVAALVASRGFINAQHRAMLDGAVDGQLGALQVFRQGAGANVTRSALQFDFDDTPELRARIAAVEGVTGVAPRIEFGAMVSNAEGVAAKAAQAAYVSVTAIEPATEARVAPRRLDFIGRGELFANADARELLLGSEVAAGLGADPAVRPPEPLWPALLANDRDGAPNGEALLVGGTLLSAMPGDRRVALVPLHVAQRLLRMEAGSPRTR